MFYAVSELFQPYNGGFVLCTGGDLVKFKAVDICGLPSPRHDQYNMAVSMYMSCSLNNNNLNTIFSVLDTITAKKIERVKNERRQLVLAILPFLILSAL